MTTQTNNIPVLDRAMTDFEINYLKVLSHQYARLLIVAKLGLYLAQVVICALLMLISPLDLTVIQILISSIISGFALWFLLQENLEMALKLCLVFNGRPVPASDLDIIPPTTQAILDNSIRSLPKRKNDINLDKAFALIKSATEQKRVITRLEYNMVTYHMNAFRKANGMETTLKYFEERRD
jgi:hypothetical protein